MQSCGSILNCLLLVLLACGTARSLIIPEELPSLLSIIYSNIPPIKNGFDTRFGLGFRLGQHADVQLLTEIGPQIETQPLGEPERRRHANAPPDLKVRRKVNLRPVEDEGKEPEANSWLAKWHRSTLQNLRSASLQDSDPKVNDPGVDDHAMEHLSKLYKKQ